MTLLSVHAELIVCTSIWPDVDTRLTNRIRFAFDIFAAVVPFGSADRSNAISAGLLGLTFIVGSAP